MMMMMMLFVLIAVSVCFLFSRVFLCCFSCLYVQFDVSSVCCLKENNVMKQWSKITSRSARATCAQNHHTANSLLALIMPNCDPGTETFFDN